jgi:hypothetical protein
MDMHNVSARVNKIIIGQENEVETNELRKRNTITVMA